MAYHSLIRRYRWVTTIFDIIWGYLAIVAQQMDVHERNKPRSIEDQVLAKKGLFHLFLAKMDQFSILLWDSTKIGNYLQKWLI